MDADTTEPAMSWWRRLLRRPRDRLSTDTIEAIAGVPAGDIAPAALERRGALRTVLARKVLQQRLRERSQALESDPADLQGLEPEIARLLVRAMGAAGHADGRLDARERVRIRTALETTVLEPEEREALAAELEAPPSLEGLARQVTTAETAVRFYAVSLAAAKQGKAANRSYLNYLAHRLAVPSDVVVRLNRRFDVPV